MRDEEEFRIPSLRLEDTLLKRMWPDIEKHRRYRCSSAGMSDCFSKRRRLSGVERHEFATVPIRLKLCYEFFDNMGQVLCSDFQVPLQPARHCCLRHVRRSDVCG